MFNLKTLEAAIVTEANKIWTTLKPLVAQIAPMVEASAEEIATIALNAVAAEAPKVISGQEKFSNATSTVLTSLGAQSKSISAAAAAAAVQTSYNFLSALLHPPVSAK